MYLSPLNFCAVIQRHVLPHPSCFPFSVFLYLPSLLSHLLSLSCTVPSSLLQTTPVRRSVHHKLLIDCICTLCGEVLLSNAHNNKSLAVIFHECLSCCWVSVLCWCFITWLLCFLTHYLLLTLCASFPSLRHSQPRGCHHYHACSSFCILPCTTAVNFLSVPAPCKQTSNEIGTF